MDGTIVCSGTFIGQAAPQVIMVPSDYDYIYIKNFTASASSETGNFEFYWQKGMPRIIVWTNTSGVVTVDTKPLSLIAKYDADTQPAQSVPYTINSISNNNQPAIGYSVPPGELFIFDGDIVIFYGTEQLSTNTVYWTANSTGVGTFVIGGPSLANPPGNVATKGFMRRINFGPFFRPTTNTIVDISQGYPAAITTALAHGLKAGCIVRFNIPKQSGMTGLNSNQMNDYKYYTVQTVITPQLFTVDADTTNFPSFKWTTTSDVIDGSQFPTYTVVGQNTADTLEIDSFPETNDILADAVQNVQFIGATLAPLSGPAGSFGDVVYWVAGKVTYDE